MIYMFDLAINCTKYGKIMIAFAFIRTNKSQIYPISVKKIFLSNSIETKWFVHLLAIPLSSYIIPNALCCFKNEGEGVYQSYGSVLRFVL